MRRSLNVLAVLAGLAAPVSFASTTPLDELIAPADGKTACFSRVYDAAHLRAHPQQKSTAMFVWLKYDKLAPDKPDVALTLNLALRQRGETEPLFAQGGCDWSEQANRDVEDRPIIKTFKKQAGADCMMTARPDVFDVLSAEEGGYLIIDRGKDRDTLMVYLDDTLTMVKQADRAKGLGISFGEDDRVFMLRRVDAKACDFVERAMSR
jgi:hypothetical protein